MTLLVSTVSAQASEDQYVLAGLKVHVVSSALEGQNDEQTTNVLCLSNVVLEPGLLITSEVEALQADFPDAVLMGEDHFCVAQDSIPHDRVVGILTHLNRLPSAVARRFAEAQARLQAASVEAKSEATAAAPASAEDFAATKQCKDEATTLPPIVPPRHHTLKSVGVLTGVSVVAMGIIAMLPPEISKWKRSDTPWDDAVTKFKTAWTTPPVWDHDEWAVNYIGHPVTGMYTYLVERNYNSGILRSFLFSTGASLAWEYLIEAWAEQPSMQDILFTSTIGSVLGEANYQLTQWLRKDGFRKWEKVVVTILNPVYVIQNGYK